MQLCSLRHPSFGLHAGELVPEALLDYIAHQVGAPTAALRAYGHRAQSKLDHIGKVAIHLGLSVHESAV